jgi:hypothetical protein
MARVFRWAVEHLEHNFAPAAAPRLTHEEISVLERS